MVELNLTKRQQEIFDYIRRYGAEHGYPPTVRDIGKAIGLTSSSTVHAHLANLEKVGLLRRDPTKPRALEILVDKAKQVVSPERAARSSARSPPARRCSPRRTSRTTCAVPGDRRWRRGRVRPARQGRLDEERGDPRGRPRGGPAPGQRDSNGEIVVALVDDEATVKRFFKEEDHVRLQPENEALEPILVTRRRGAGACGRCLQEGLMTTRCPEHTAAARLARALRGRPRTRAHAGAAPRSDPGGRARPAQVADCPVCRGSMSRRRPAPRSAATADRS